MKAANDAIYDSPGPLQAHRVGVEAVYAACDEAQPKDLANRDYGYACFTLKVCIVIQQHQSYCFTRTPAHRWGP